jgi:hypothetical protein
MIHTINIGIHAIVGTVALLIGFLIILYPKGSIKHKRLGVYFLVLLLVVVATGFLGWLFFRSNSFLLMLTLLSGYTGFSGYRSVKLKENRSSRIDVLIAIAALLTGTSYIVWLNESNATWNPGIVYPTLFGLILVTTYDIAKYLWFHQKLRTWWLYEHIYKLLSSHSALFSAFCGTVLPDYKPYSQIMPSIISLWLIAFFIFQQVRLRQKRKQNASISL